MWIRWITQPWWTRWLLTSVVLLAFYGGITLAQTLEHPGRPPAWVAPAVLGTCLIGGALGATSQRMRMAPCTAVVAGLTDEQRRQLAAAIKPGPLPTDPAVLAGAVRLHNIGRVERERRPLWLAWAIIAAANFYASRLASMPSNAVVGLALAIVAALYAVLLLWGSVREKQTQSRWAALAAAADADVSATAIIAAAQDVPARLNFRSWACLIGAALVIGGSYAATNGAVRSAQLAECRLAAGVVNYIADRSELLDANRLGGSDPPLPAYQRWVAQLFSDNEAAQGKSISADVTRVSERAAAVVQGIEDARQSSPQTPPRSRRSAPRFSVNQ